MARGGAGAEAGGAVFGWAGADGVGWAGGLGRVGTQWKGRHAEEGGLLDSYMEGLRERGAEPLRQWDQE